MPWRTQEDVDPGGDGPPLQRAFAWVAAGVVALGLSLAVVSGAAVAAADSGSDSGASSSSSSSSDSATSKSDSDAKESDSDKPSDTDKESDHDSTSAKADDEASADEPEAREHKRKSTAKASADDDATAADQTGGDVSQADSVDTADQPDATQADPVTHTSDAAETIDLTTDSARAPPLSLVTADDVAQASPWQTAWEDFVRRLQYTFFNKAPTLAPENGVQLANGQVVGRLGGQSNNGYALTYTMVEGPKHGTVELDQALGVYLYTPSVFDSRFTDTFVITADNGVAAQLPGLAGALQRSLHVFAQRLRLAGPDTISATINVRAWFPNNTVGDPLDAQYWAEQHFNNCVLMSVAMIEGQLTGVRPTDQTEQDIIDLASRTPSVVDPDKMMWTGPTAEGVKNLDGAELLRMKGFDVDYRYYSDVQYESGTYAQGQPALRDLKADLAAGSGVFVAVNAKTLWTAEIPGMRNGQFFGPSNHAIVVLAIDESRGVVWINDSGLSRDKVGQGAAVSLGAFMYAWAAGGYQSITASVKVPAEQEQSRLVAA